MSRNGSRVKTLLPLSVPQFLRTMSDPPPSASSPLASLHAASTANATVSSSSAAALPGGSATAANSLASASKKPLLPGGSGMSRLLSRRPPPPPQPPAAVMRTISEVTGDGTRAATQGQHSLSANPSPELEMIEIKMEDEEAAMEDEDETSLSVSSEDDEDEDDDDDDDVRTAFGGGGAVNGPIHHSSVRGGGVGVGGSRSSNSSQELYQRRPLLSSSHDLQTISPVEDGYYQRNLPSHHAHLNGSAVRIDIPSVSGTSAAGGGGGATDAADARRGKRATAKRYPAEWRKALIAAVFTFVGWIATMASLAVIHEWRPVTEPLPDQFLDSVNYQSWGLSASEVMIQIQVAIAAFFVFFHKHRFIVMRRVFFILGLLYGYRAITMFVTVLPNANSDYHCAPKLSEDGKSLTFNIVVMRVLKIFSGGGLTINGQHVFCGDYIYSGHTMALVMCCLIVNEYTPKKWFLLQWLLYLNGSAAVVCLLLGRGHYTIDCVIAYYITTRVWWMYHTVANYAALKQANQPLNHLAKLWWWPVLQWFEVNYPGGPLPFGLSLPFPVPRRCRRTNSHTVVHVHNRRNRNVSTAQDLPLEAVAMPQEETTSESGGIARAEDRRENSGVHCVNEAAAASIA